MKIGRRKRTESDELPVEPTNAERDVRLAQTLVDSGKVSRAEVDAALLGSGGGGLAERIIARGSITDEGLAAVLAEKSGFPILDFREIEPPAEALATLSAEQAAALQVLPVAIDEQAVTIAVLDPSPEHLNTVAAAIGKQIRVVVATRRDLQRALGTAYSATKDVVSQVQEFEVRDAMRQEASRLEGAASSDEAPVVRVVQMIITQGLRDRASDIHIEPFGERVRVRYRIDGALHDVLDLPGSIGPAVVSRVKILAEMNIVERRRSQDGQISMEVEGRGVDIRVATMAVVGGEKVVMRLLDKSRPLFKLEQLGMPHEIATRFSALIKSPYGMVICAGPTGGGKTTTLYAALGEVNSVDRNIMTIEDPVEYTFDSINQIQINEQAGVTFAAGLKAILRQDPDIILVGEVRDVDTARIAVQSALTGHFVLSSLHATESVSALYRLLDMGIEPFLIASSVTAVMAQRLVRRSCTSCLETYQPSPDELEFLRTFGGHEPTGGFVHGVGCNFCAHTGYLDRIGVYELLVITDEVRESIIDHVSHEEMRKLAISQGMQTLQEQAVRLVMDGTTTASEVMRSIYVVGV